MDCREARRLLDQGVEPGSRNPVRATLGFHLVGCAACRSYRERVHQQVLAGLLFQPLAHPAAKPERSAPAKRRRSRSEWRTFNFAVAGLLILAFMLVAGRVAVAALSIQRNVQSYIVPTPTAAPVATSAPLPTLATLASAGGGAADNSSGNAAPAHLEADPPAPTVTPAERSESTPRPSLSSTRQAIAIVPTVARSITEIPTLPPMTPTPVVPLAGSAVNVLLLGSDQRPGEQGTSRTDTVIVAHIDPAAHRIALLSLPRDLIVNIPGYGYSRINAAHVYGDLYPELGGGIALARQTVGDLLGTPIDYAVLVNFEGFIGLIDAIGGVDVDVPNALYDGQYPTMDYGYMEVYFDPGPQHFDGQRALQYARIRHGDSDFERARRQQQIIVSAIERLRQQNPLQLLDTANSVSEALRGYVWTDMPQERMIGLAWALRDMQTQSIERYLVDENMISFNGVSGACSSADDYWAECLDQGALQVLVQQWLGQSSP